MLGIEGLKNVITDKIKELNVIREYDLAQECEAELQKINEDFPSDAFMQEFTTKALEELEKLNRKIDAYMSQEGHYKRVEMMKNYFLREIGKWEEGSHEKDTLQLLEELKKHTKQVREVVDRAEPDGTKWKKFSRKLDEFSGAILMQIFVRQMQNGETIDTSLIDEITSSDALLKEIQKRLVDLSKNKEDAEAFEILDFYQNLTEEDLKKERVWQILSGSIGHVVEQSKQAVEPKREIAVAVPVEPEPRNEMIESKKGTFFQNLRHKFERGKSVYVFAKMVDGQYQDPKIEYHDFPPKKKLLQRCKKECIGLEINLKQKGSVFIDNIEEGMPHLQKLTFGKNVVTVKKDTDIYHYGLNNSLQRIEFSDDVETLEEMSLFQGYEKLKEVRMGNGIKNRNNLF